MSDLPADWQQGPLGDLLKVRYGKALPAANRLVAGPVPLVGSGGRMAAWTKEPLSAGPAVIIGRKGSVGNVILEAEESWPIDTTYFAEVPEGLFEPRFLSHQLMSLNLASFDSSTTVPSLRRQDLEAVSILVPPLDEQRRIVDILEDHLSRLDAAGDAIATAARRLATFRKSAIDRIVWDSEAPTAQVGSLLAEPMRNGYSARASATGTVRIATLTAVTRGQFTEEFTKLTAADPARVRSLWMEPGDVFVQRANTPDLVGSSAIYRGEPNWAVFPDLLIRLRADPRQLTPDYLALALQTERSHRALRQKAKGLAGSMPKIDQAAIAGLEIPVPSGEAQARAVARARDIEASAQALEEALMASARRKSVLRGALLEAAFSGRLTGRSSDVDLTEEMAAT